MSSVTSLPQNPAQWPAETVAKTFYQTAKKFGPQTALKQIVPIEGASKDAPYVERFKEISLTWKQYKHEVKAFAKALHAVGVQSDHSVVVQGNNSINWLVTLFATTMINAKFAGVYPTNGPELSHHAVKNARAEVVVVEDEKQLQKYAGVNDSAIKCFVVWNKINNPEITKQFKAPVYSWEEFVAKGAEVPKSALLERMEKQKPDQVCSLIYTSGTTDLPKAAALTHDNLIWTGRNAGTEVKFDETHRGISYLPLSHVAAQMIDGITPAIFGYSVTIAPSDALKGSNLKQHLIHTNPTYFMAVPRVWEKFMEAMQEAPKMPRTDDITVEICKDWAQYAIKQIVGTVRQKLLDDTKWLPEEIKNTAELAKTDTWTQEMRKFNAIRLDAEQYALSKVNQLILGKIGLGECKVFASGAGALEPKTANFFKDLDVKIVDLYGLSETTGPLTMSSAKSPSGSSGRALPGTDLKIADKDADGKGEIRAKGRHIMKEYWNNSAATKSAFDKEGFFRTGDEGFLDADGNLFITGRLKELIKTSGGENIPPVRIEQRIKEELAIIDQAVVIGDKRNFLTCLVTLLTELDSEGNPTNRLAKSVVDQIAKLGSTATTLEEVLADEAVLKHLMAGINKANKKADSEAQKVQKITALPESLSVANGFLTPTQKLKRSVIEKHYAQSIENMYRNA